MTALTSRAGKASRPSTVAMKMPQTDNGMRIRVMPLVRACKHGCHIVESTHGERQQ